VIVARHKKRFEDEQHEAEQKPSSKWKWFAEEDARNEAAAVARLAPLVDEDLYRAADTEQYEFDMLPWDTHPGIPASEMFDDVERHAVEEATIRKNFAPLASLLRPEHPLNRYSFVVGGTVLRSHLSDETWTLVAERLCGRYKHGRGAPKMWAEKRRATYPAHDAADMVPAIRDTLRRWFPQQSASDIRDRALAIAAYLKGIKQGQTLKNLRARGKNNRRRIN
jgi:hypothetical protein